VRRDPLAQLRDAVVEAAANVAGMDTTPSGVSVERPKKAAHGDFATNAAMICAPVARDNPRNVAKKISEALAVSLGDSLSGSEVAGPGFLNLRLTDGWYASALSDVLAAGADFGAGVADSPERINLEFVSANPTGPMHLGHGRNAAYGDALARIFEFAGHEVAREFYINDFGTQVQIFADSIAAVAKGEDVPENGYQGDYIKQLAEQIDGVAGLDREKLGARGVELMIEQIRHTLERMRVSVDVWFSEKTLHHDVRFEEALGKLREAGFVYEHDGALWLRTTDLGDDKDRVLRRGNGEYTYFATDIAYHQDKRARGFERLIDVWGADHHGYVARMKAAYQALGGDPDHFEPVIMQLVNLTEGGERVQMSKRAGEFITVDDLLDDIGPDALRFFLVQRSHDTTMDLDLALAREQSDKNPVYYVQYAHARIASILRKAKEGGAGVPAKASLPGVELHESERALVRKLLDFPDEIAEAVARRGPHRLTVYGRDLGASFAAFYRDCQVIGEAPDVQDFRLALCSATQQVLARTLDLVGVTAPESM
jgi:arginyl-tRNA synthetase